MNEVILDGPIQLDSGAVLENRRFILKPSFRWDTRLAAIYVRDGANDVTIRNVSLQTWATSWQSRWNTYNEPGTGGNGIPSGLVGIRAQGAPGLTIDGLDVRGFPRCAIEGFGFDGARVRNVYATRVFQGINLSAQKPSHGILIENVIVRDTWGPGPGYWPGTAGYPSALRPGQFIGSDGMALSGLRHAVVRNCRTEGEQFASFKFVGPQGCTFEGLIGATLMIQGTVTVDGAGEQPSAGCRLVGSTFDKSLGYGALVDQGHGLQLSWNIDSLDIWDTRLVCPVGKNGSGAQAAVRVQVGFRDCHFQGFNGTNGGSGQAYALELVDDSVTNSDFETGNRFVDQNLIWKRS